MECEPAVRLEMLNEAAPEVSAGEVAMVVFPSSKEMVPVGTPEVAGVTAVEKAMASPNTAAITDGVTVVEVPARFTSCETAGRVRAM